MCATRRLQRFLLPALVCLSIVSAATAADMFWNGGNNDWTTSAADWVDTNGDPAHEPTLNDTAIFNMPDSVDMAIPFQVIGGLTMSGGIGLDTNANDLEVNGLVELSDSSTDLFVRNLSFLEADAITINNGADINMSGGQIIVDEESGNGLLNIKAGAGLHGNGLVRFDDSVGVGVELFNLDGTLTATSFNSLQDIQGVAAATLTIQLVDVHGVIDMDGNNGDSTINVERNDTLVIDGVPNEPYSGTLNLGSGAMFHMVDAWSLDGTLNTVPGGIGSFSSTARITGAALTQTGTSIINVDAGETLRISSSTFTTTNGTINNSGHIIFDSNITDIRGITFNMTGSTASLTVNPGDDVFIVSNDLKLDGAGTATNIVTIGSGGLLDLELSEEADETFTGTMRLNGGVLNVTTSDGDWFLGGNVVVGANTGTSEISHFINDDEVTIDAQTSIGADSYLVINVPVVYDATSVFGAGTLIQNNTATFINGDTGISVGLYGWENAATTIQPGASLILNVIRFGFNDEQYDETVNVNSGTLDVTLADGDWGLGLGGVINLTKTTDIIPVLRGSDIQVDGTINADGHVEIYARMDLSSSVEVNVIDGDGSLTLRGGSLSDPNTINGGEINGPGELIIAPGTALEGRGSIHAPVALAGARLFADGALFLRFAPNGGVVGTAGQGILDVFEPWNTNQVDYVELQGGELRGAAVTNDGVIRGSGRVNVDQLINNNVIQADGFTLLLDSFRSDKFYDWDGANGDGTLYAVDGDLNLLDNGEMFVPFSGGIVVGEYLGGPLNHTIRFLDIGFSNGPSSHIRLDGGIYRSDNSQHLFGGTMVVDSALSEIDVLSGSFLEDSTTTLYADLQLRQITFIDYGAEFTSNGGRLINLSGATLRIQSLASVSGVPIINQGTLIIGSSPGQITVGAYTQSETGILEIELGGTDPKDIDQLIVTGAASLAGTLNLSLINGFVPSGGETFDFLSALGGITGAFDTINLPSLPFGLSWVVNGDDPAMLQLIVADSLLGDFNDDGTVDAADYVVWRKTDGTPAGYNTWRAHFGESAGGGAGATDLARLSSPKSASASAEPRSATVPEPSAILLLILGVAALLSARGAGASAPRLV